MPRKNILIALISLAVFGLGFFAFSEKVWADVGSEDVKVIDTNGDSVTNYRLTHSDYYIDQRTVANEGATAYNLNDTKILFSMAWDKSMRNPGIPDFCFSSAERCQGFCYGSVDDLKSWWNGDKSRVGWEDICKLVPRSARHSVVYGVQWSEISGEENILYGVDRYTGLLGRLDTSTENPVWDYFLSLIPEGASPSNSGYGPKINGFLNDGRMVVTLSGENSWKSFGNEHVRGYLIDLGSNNADPVINNDFEAKIWKCKNNYYTQKYGYRFAYNNGKVNFGSAHSDVRLINGEYWASDHGYEMWLLPESPGEYDNCQFWGDKQGFPRNLYPPSGHPSHVFYRDADWFYSDHCQWGESALAPNLGKCYITQRYWDAVSRTSAGDVMIVDWIYPRGWTRVYNKAYDISQGTPQNCIINMDINTDGKIDSADYDKYCQNNVKGDIYAYRTTCDITSAKCQRVVQNYHEFTGPNMDHGGTAIGFSSTEQGKYSYNDYLAYGKYNNWDRDDWDNNGFYHVEIQVGNSSHDINNDGHINIKDIQACIKVITNSQTDTNIIAKCNALAEPIGNTNIKDIQVIIREIIN